ncbi:MAG: SWIM zinc finger family protein [Roseiarcus sp.]
MTVGNLPRFDIAALKRVAGAAFARGEAYHRDGRVELLAVGPERVLAEVSGTEDYRVRLVRKGETFGGECTCPAFEDFGFCKHMVATALAANQAAIESTPDTGAFGRIRAHLTAKPHDALVSMILELAERDPVLFRKLDIASAGDSLDEKTLAARLSKAIDKATETRGHIGYDEAGGWAAGVEEALDALDALDSKRDGLLLKLAGRAIDRIESAIEWIDDSDGECGALLERARDIHVRAARGAHPEPLALARDLFHRELEDE